MRTTVEELIDACRAFEAEYGYANLQDILSRHMLCRAQEMGFRIAVKEIDEEGHAKIGVMPETFH